MVIWIVYTLLVAQSQAGVLQSEDVDAYLYYTLHELNTEPGLGESVEVIKLSKSDFEPCAGELTSLSGEKVPPRDEGAGKRASLREEGAGLPRDEGAGERAPPRDEGVADAKAQKYVIEVCCNKHQ